MTVKQLSVFVENQPGKLMEALETLAERYATLCDEESAAETGPARKAELTAMAADLRHAPAQPAVSFRQAVSAIWLTHLAFQFTGNFLAVGRFDRHVWPYLERDLAAGAIGMEQAQELVDCFFLKFNERAMDNGLIFDKTDFIKARERNEAAWANATPSPTAPSAQTRGTGWTRPTIGSRT